MRIRDKEFFRLFLIVYTLMFVIIFQCFDIINKMQAELKGRLYNGIILIWRELKQSVMLYESS